VRAVRFLLLVAVIVRQEVQAQHVQRHVLALAAQVGPDGGVVGELPLVQVRAAVVFFPVLFDELSQLHLADGVAVVRRRADHRHHGLVAAQVADQGVDVELAVLLDPLVCERRPPLVVHNDERDASVEHLVDLLAQFFGGHGTRCVHVNAFHIDDVVLRRQRIFGGLLKLRLRRRGGAAVAASCIALFRRGHD
jgi:hypothetical protein